MSETILKKLQTAVFKQAEGAVRERAESMFQKNNKQTHPAQKVADLKLVEKDNIDSTDSLELNLTTSSELGKIEEKAKLLEIERSEKLKSSPQQGFTSEEQKINNVEMEVAKDALKFSTEQKSDVSLGSDDLTGPKLDISLDSASSVGPKLDISLDSGDSTGPNLSVDLSKNDNSDSKTDIGFDLKPN